ncbi:MAG: DUF2339 domain-containing protein [Balneolaceae bacterium]|nr:DUF2339 domain-containing protein [Balneolaceae bacterium]
MAAFYITGFASFQLYSFLSSQLVWVFMVGVTIFALLLSLWEDEPVLSVVGTIGGLGTPFMLYTGQGSLPMLMLYTTVVLIGPVILYMIKGWKPLLWSAVVGGWLVLMVGLIVNVIDVENPSSLDRWTLQLGVLFVGAISWIIPVYREILTNREPQRWPDSANLHKKESDQPFVANVNVQVLSVLMPVCMLFYSYGLWSISSEVWGVIALIASLLIGYSYLPLRSEELFKLSLVHGFTALIMITISLTLLLDGEILLIALTLEALCLRIIASKTGDRNISLSSHILFVFIAIWMVDRLLMVTTASMPLFNLDALTELFIIGIGGIMVPAYIGTNKVNSTTVYRLTAHIALLGWFLKELSTLQDGQAYVTVAWGIYALAVLYVGFRESNIRIRLLGMATIFLVVGKLFLVDLTQINTLLRILLFIGFGAIFLLVSYFLHKNWGEPPNSPEPAKEAEVD